MPSSPTSVRCLRKESSAGVYGLLLGVVGVLLPSPALPVAQADDLRPGWTKHDRLSARPAWTEWRNALAPRGGQVVLDLSADGQTDYTIGTAAKPTAIARRAAEELRHWLRQVTGAEFAIQADSGPPQPREISVGQTNRLAAVAAEAVAAAGLDAIDRLPAEGYAVIVANTDEAFGPMRG